MIGEQAPPITAAARLIDPTAARRRARVPSPGYPHGSAPHIGLVDGTLNKASMWGRGMLDAAAAALQGTFPRATLGWESFNPLANEPPDRWAAGMAARYGGLVVSAGDCVTCTTRGVRDAIWFDATGAPAAVVCTAAVDEVVRSVCATYGMRGLRVCRVATSLFGLSRNEIAAATAPFVADLGALMAEPPP